MALTTTTALALTACGPGSPEAGRPNTAPPPSTPVTSPSSSATPSDLPSGPPERPADAKGLSLAAAERFVRYYSSLLNYAADTGDTTPLLGASEAGCENCKAYAAAVQKSNAANGLLAGDYREKLTEVAELVRGEDGQLGGSARVTVGAYTTKETATSKPFASKPATYTREFALSSQAGSWVMYEMKSVKQ
ncbi:DUF6318 family protein [Kribbella sandramycini]|uniref:DUF6318 family protein n=1 Tax=Kribbella sandramycini TaxID=60450 RepID=UPI0023535010|nr:DUF6318 family protein [Kribbella sandramycini]